MTLAPGHAPVPASDERDILWSPQAAFVGRSFKAVLPQIPGEPQPIPPETYDHVVARPERQATIS